MERVRLAAVKSRNKPINRVDASTRPSIPLGPAPLIKGEDVVGYDELLARVSSGVKSADILEDIWVRDYVDLTWEIFRLRRLKAALLTATAYEGLQRVLQPLLDDDDEIAQLVRDWARQESNAVEQVNNLLASADLTMDAVIAQALSQNIEGIERIDRMIAMAETRRNSVLREIEWHRTTLAYPLQRTIEELEHREIRVLEGTKSAERKVQSDQRA
jgi:hypothetical protein